MALNPKQAAFVREYRVDRNATQAAKRAGYSKKTAHSQGPRLLEHVEVKAAIKAADGKTATKLGLKAEDVLAELQEIAFTELRVFELSGDGVAPSIRAPDKLKALELLGKHFKLFTEKLDVTGRITLEDLVAGPPEGDE